MDWLRLSLVALAFAGESELDLVSSTRSDTGMIGQIRSKSEVGLGWERMWQLSQSFFAQGI